MNQSNHDHIIFCKIQTIIKDAMRIEEKKIIPKARLFTDLGAESLDILDIRFRMQELFGIQISDGDVIRRLGKNLSIAQIEEKLTVGSLVEYVKQRLADKVSE
jgi:acyl carrier protein